MLLAISCGYKPVIDSAVQIDCPRSTVILLSTTKAEVIKAAKQALIKKRQEGTKEGYTVLRMPDGRSTAIYGVPPENFYECTVININADVRALRGY